VLIVGNNHKMNNISEKTFKLGGYETIVCCDEVEARKIRLFEGDASQHFSIQTLHQIVVVCIQQIK